jgi:hypothetical protein
LMSRAAAENDPASTTRQKTSITVMRFIHVSRNAKGLFGRHRYNRKEWKRVPQISGCDLLFDG